MFQYEGPRSLSSTYDTSLFTQARQHATIVGIMRRKPTFFSQPQWLIISKTAPVINHATRLLDIGSLIPDLLAETDKVRSNICSEHIVNELLQKLSHTSQELVTWIDEFCLSMDHEISTIIDLSDMEAYNEAMNGDATFLPVFKFASFRTAWRIILGWTFHYTILKAIHDILTTRPDATYKNDVSEIEFEMLCVITNLCMTIPQLFARHFGALSRMVINLPLLISTEFYLSRGQAMELNWCKRVAKAVYDPREGLKPIRMAQWKERLRSHSRCISWTP